MRAREPAECGGPDRRVARGGAARERPVSGPRAGGAAPAVAVIARLGLRHGAAALRQRSRGVLAARQAARRLELSQRDGLYPRQSCQLRRMARSGQPRMGLRRRATVLQAVRGQPAWPLGVPRTRRPARRGGRPRVAGFGGVRRGGRGAVRGRDQPGLQRRGAGRHRAVTSTPCATGSGGTWRRRSSIRSAAART